MKLIVKNVAIEYNDEGAGPVIVLLHGWKDTLHTFDALASLLATSRRVIRLDLPGFGKSEVPKNIWELKDYAEFLGEFVEKLTIHPDIVVGHSFGGRIAIKAVASRLIKTKKLVLIASAGVAKRNLARNWFFVILAKLGKILTFIPPFTFWREELRKKLYQRAGSDYWGAGDLKDTFLTVVREDLSRAAKTIPVRTLLIWGDGDVETPLGDGKRLAGLIKDSEFKIISGKGHFVHQEAPQEVLRAIKEFASL